MIRQKKNVGNRLPGVSTASLPDIVFILLFFFMTVTTIKDEDLLVDNFVPVPKTARKELSKQGRIEIFIGALKHGDLRTGEGRASIQLEDKLVHIDEIGYRALAIVNSMPEHYRKRATIIIKADSQVKMNLIEEVKDELRKVNLLKINYAAVVVSDKGA